MSRFDHEVYSQCERCGNVSEMMVCHRCSSDLDCELPRETDQLEMANTCIILVKPTFTTYALQGERKIWNDRHYAGKVKVDTYHLKTDKVIYAGLDIIGNENQLYRDIENHVSSYKMLRNRYSVMMSNRYSWDFKRKDYYLRQIQNQVLDFMKLHYFDRTKVIETYYDAQGNKESVIVKDSLLSDAELASIEIPISLDMRYLALYFDDAESSDRGYVCLMARPIHYGVASSEVREWEFDNFDRPNKRIMNKRVSETLKIS